MALKGGKELRKVYGKAKDEEYGFIASNIAEPNIPMGLLDGSEEMDSDLVTQLSHSASKFAGNGNDVAGLKAMGKYIDTLSDDYDIGVFLNMDHLTNLDFIEAAIDTGLPSSIMIDASKKPFEENVKKAERSKIWSLKRKRTS